MKYLAALLLGLFVAVASFAQNKANISGNIVTVANTPVSAATVGLFTAKDSLLIKSVVTSTAGFYKILLVKPGKYFITVTSVGYIKKTIPDFIIKEGQNFPVESIILLALTTSLSGVTINGRKPMIEIRADRTVFNVENSINSIGSNAFELLQKSPGVSVDKDDNISMQGKNGVKIYIDGKPTQMSGSDLSSYLRSVNSADIESIELITNPSAKYDAAGNAGIINIRLKKNKNYGANGSVNAGISFGHTPKYNNAISLNYRNKKINIFSNYSNRFGETKNIFNLYRIQNDSSYDQHSKTVDNNKPNNFKAGIDFSINNKNTLGILVIGNFNTEFTKTTSSTLISPNNTGIPNRILFASNELPETRSNIDYNINYRYADTSGKELEIDADFISFTRAGSSYQPNYYNDPFTNVLLDEKIYRNNTPTDINIYTAKADVEQPFYKGKLSYGAKITDVSTKNTFDFYNVFGTVSVKDAERSNKFNYSENVNALYLNYNRILSKKTTLQAGVRMENTVSKGNLLSEVPQPDDVVKRNYLDFFPSAAITYIVDKNNTINASYSKRIDRPGYQDLNPFEDKIDELTYRKGNAFLKPQYTNSVQLSHTLFGKYITSLGYSHVKDYFAQIIDTLGNRSFITEKNIAEQKLFNINVSAPFTITKWWTAVTIFNGYHSDYNADFGGGKTINLKIFAFSWYAQQVFTIKKGPSFEVSGRYNSPTLWGGTFKTDKIWYVDAGVQQKILKNAGTIKLSLTDVFKTIQYKGSSDYGGSHLDATGYFESQQLRINFSYRFGNTSMKAARQRRLELDEENKRLDNSGGIGQ